MPLFKGPPSLSGCYQVEKIADRPSCSESYVLCDQPLAYARDRVHQKQAVHTWGYNLRGFLLRTLICFGGATFALGESGMIGDEVTHFELFL